MGQLGVLGRSRGTPCGEVFDQEGLGSARGGGAREWTGEASAALAVSISGYGALMSVTVRWLVIKGIGSPPLISRRGGNGLQNLAPPSGATLRVEGDP